MDALTPIFIPCHLCKQLGDDALVEDVQGEMAEVFVASKDEDEEETEGIMDSPEVATRKARLKEKMHQLATQNHGKHKLISRKKIDLVWIYINAHFCRLVRAHKLSSYL